MIKLQPIPLTVAIALITPMPVAIALPGVSVPDVSTPDVSVPDVSTPEVPSPELSVVDDFSAYDFTVEVTDGPLTGQQYGGSFCYPQNAISGEGTEVLSEAEGLSVSMDFFGNVYTASDDTAYPDFPTLTLEDGEVKQLDFWIEPGDRQVWWDLPHWDVSLSSQDDTADCAIAPPDALLDESVTDVIDF